MTQSFMTNLVAQPLAQMPVRVIESAATATVVLERSGCAQAVVDQQTLRRARQPQELAAPSGGFGAHQAASFGGAPGAVISFEEMLSYGALAKSARGVCCGTRAASPIYECPIELAHDDLAVEGHCLEGVEPERSASDEAANHDLAAEGRRFEAVLAERSASVGRVVHAEGLADELFAGLSSGADVASWRSDANSSLPKGGGRSGGFCSELARHSVERSLVPAQASAPICHRPTSMWLRQRSRAIAPKHDRASKVVPGRHAQSFGVLGEVHELLRRLSPSPRRSAIQTMLSEHGRRLLESWMVMQRRQGGCATEDWPASGREAVRATPWSKTDVPRKLAKLATPGCPKAVPCRDDGLASIRGVVTYTQTSGRAGHKSVWYYAAVCLPGLHVITCMHRDRTDAVREHTALCKVKDRLSDMVSAGFKFDDAARLAFAQVGIFGGENSKASSCVSSGAMRSSEGRRLRFYASVTLVNGFQTLVRGPCVHDLEVALGMRRRMLEAMGPAMVRLMPHGECMKVFATLRFEFLEMHRQSAPTPAVAQRAFQSFCRAERIAIEKRDAGTLAALKRLLQQIGLGQQPKGRKPALSTSRAVRKTTPSRFEDGSPGTLTGLASGGLGLVEGASYGICHGPPRAEDAAFELPSSFEGSAPCGSKRKREESAMPKACTSSEASFELPAECSGRDHVAEWQY
mmetsp:Transcript_129688/g.414924  ORF Transcript_129688/g.414924 Transcript_129688/m.414924 type:complete len:689 (+) Transcript_129688:250-2316(+)